MPDLWDTLTEGSEREPLVDDPLTVTDFVRYQGASGDMNPIHHDTAFARQAGYPGPFAVGMLQAGKVRALGTNVRLGQAEFLVAAILRGGRRRR